MNYLIILAMIVVAAIGGAFLYYGLDKKESKKTKGSIIIDISDDRKPYMYLNISVDPEELMNSKRAMFNIIIKDK